MKKLAILTMVAATMVLALPATAAETTRVTPGMTKVVTIEGLWAFDPPQNPGWDVRIGRCNVFGANAYCVSLRVPPFEPNMNQTVEYARIYFVKPPRAYTVDFKADGYGNGKPAVLQGDTLTFFNCLSSQRACSPTKWTRVLAD